MVLSILHVLTLLMAGGLRLLCSPLLLELGSVFYE